MVNTIHIEHLVHQNRMKLFMKFEYDLQTIQLTKTLPGVKWSHSHKGWYIGYHDEALSLIKDTFTPKGIEIKLVNDLRTVEKPKCGACKACGYTASSYRKLTL
jgi:hypothetical protein